jgi:4,5-DOPA dioxygenase extradiol
MKTINESSNKFTPPVIFMSHLGPNQIFETDSKMFKESKKFGEKMKGKIKAIICISAHYYDDNFCIMSSDYPSTYHDHGFEEIFSFNWNVKGSKEIAKEIFTLLASFGLKCSFENDRGYDHGCWSSLYPFGLDHEDFKIPVVQVSLPEDEDINKMITFGKALKELRETREYLIFGTGTITHNLRLFFKGMQGHKVDKSSVEKIENFREWFNEICLNNSDQTRLNKMLEYEKHPNYKLAHPSNDHFLPILPILVAAGKSKGNLMWEDEKLGFKLSSYYFD